jgi:hypothetical protein
LSLYRVKEEERSIAEANRGIKEEDGNDENQEGSSEDNREVLEFLPVEKGVEVKEEAMGEVATRLSVALDEVFSIEGASIRFKGRN